MAACIVFAVGLRSGGCSSSLAGAEDAGGCVAGMGEIPNSGFLPPLWVCLATCVSPAPGWERAEGPTEDGSWMQLRVSGSHSGADRTLQPCSSDRRNSEVWCWKGTGNTLLHCAPLTCCCTRGSWCVGWGSRAPRAGQGGGTQQWVPLLFSSAHHPLHFPIWHSSDGSPP